MVVAQSAGAVVGSRIAWHRAKRSRTARHRPTLGHYVAWYHGTMVSFNAWNIRSRERYKGKRMG